MFRKILMYLRNIVISSGFDTGFSTSPSSDPGGLPAYRSTGSHRRYDGDVQLRPHRHCSRNARDLWIHLSWSCKFIVEKQTSVSTRDVTIVSLKLDYFQGRALSRAKSRRNLDYQQVLNKLDELGISIRVASPKLVMEEAPESYKNVTDVVNTCHAAGISKKCIKLRPIAVIKG